MSRSSNPAPERGGFPPGSRARARLLPGGGLRCAATAAALDIPPHGWVNLHFSVLPAWRGAAPVQHAVCAGDEITGATTFLFVKELDAGPRSAR